ncbi:MAG: transglutaminase domain-containing protein [Saprospiraceae bacterium]
MKKKSFLLFTLFSLVTQISFTQNLPIINANSKTVDIKEDNVLTKKAWTIMPMYKPDVFISTKLGKTVTFYTDVDSISVKMQPDLVFDFIILLNGKDSAYTQIKYEPPYLEKLKLAKDYQKETEIDIPKFTYQDASDPNLVALRNGFNLDSIAGTGNETSQILNLLHWIHDLVPHDGNHINPTVNNAMSMINLCQTGERGLNCRGLAIVLNECYLAMGFKSRFVTCMPKDSIFQDCHVINSVYSNDLQKWIWVDPTHDAYVMDEKGELLGLGEVREKLINNEMVILNPDANWNNKQSTVKEYYLLEYMAKNLYRFSCVLRSQYNIETFKKGKKIEYVELIPLDGLNQNPKISKNLLKESNVTFKTYKTNDPDIFWAKPE